MQEVFEKIIKDIGDHFKYKIDKGEMPKSMLDELEPFLMWCERTGNDFTRENYQEFIDQEDISMNVI